MKKKIRRKQNIFGSSERPRLVVVRSLKHIYCQVVDDSQRKTIIGASSKSKEIAEAIKKAASACEKSKIVGKLIADKLKEQKIESVVFDRNGYKYHGRIKELAEGARENGLKF